MSMKTILVPMEHHDMQSALQTALLSGQRTKSYIEGFALRSQVIELVGGIDAMGLPLDRFQEDVEEEAKKAKQISKTSCRNTACRAQPRRQDRCHSAGWTMRQRGKVLLAAMAAFST